MIYVASPYTFKSPSIERVYWKMKFRHAAVERYVAHLIKQGEFPYSPIVYAHEISHRYALPTDAEWWKSFNEHMLRKADVLHVYNMEGWEQSKGIAMEMQFAEACGIPIVHVPVLPN